MTSTVTSMGAAASRQRAARLLAVLAVLLGLLAMHGLAGAHHAAAASAAPHSPASASASESATESATVPASAPADEAVAHHRAAAKPEVPHDAVALAGSPGPNCDEDCADIAMLCLAVLTGAALVALLARRGSSPPLVAPIRARAPAPTPPIRHARGPDPVRELCVSRT